MKKITLVFIISLCAICLHSYSSGTVRKAKREIQVYDYSSAITILKKIVDQNDPMTIRQATLLLAECYRKKNDCYQARTWYGKVIKQKNPDALNYFFYAMALRSTGDYNQAKKYFLKFDSLDPKDPRGKIYAGYCDSINSWEKKEAAYDVKNVSGLNTTASEFGPIFVGNKICFTSDRYLKKTRNDIYGWTGNNYLKIFFAEVKNPEDLFQEFGEPFADQGKVNSTFHNGPATFDSGGSVIYFNRTYQGKGKIDQGNIREDLLRIFYSKKEGNAWSKPKPFRYNSENYSVGHPSLTPDGNTFYFVSDMPGGKGGTDIYVSYMENGKWTKPLNLGQKINTFGNEMFPHIAADGDLYFASDALPGYGGLDIFVSRKVNGEWSNPVNLGKHINSSFDDFALTYDKSAQTGLFCSNRPGGKGGDDIYLYKQIPPPIVSPQFYISGCVKDKITNQPVPGATIFLLNEKESQVIIVKTNNTGCFRTQVALSVPYKAKAMESGYIADCESFRFDASETRTDLTIPRDLLLDRLTVNRKFKLENIYYDFDKWNIRPDAEPSLNSLIRIMNENNITVELGSHTDCRGTAEYNQKLSQRRAESAVQYIISHGINPTRITAKGYGESEPVNNCIDGVNCTESQHQANRRTEFKVVSFDLKPDETFDPGKYKEGESIDIRALPDNFFNECK